MLLKVEHFFNKIADFIGFITAILMIAMMLNVFYDVIMRYFFNSGSIAMQEMEWHLFSVVILLGVSYALKEDGHVRVDIIYDNLHVKKKAWINIIGCIVFLIPFSLFIGTGSYDFVMEAFTSHEISGDPGGLTNRWIIKAFIPASFYLLVFVSIGFVVKNINLYRGAHDLHQKNIKGASK
ncbi:MAG: TRAP transporter small permease subunit [Sulfurospirillum sp.]|nr:TRAP transporter small permease subunit [Sulfurospirillum sp.]